MSSFMLGMYIHLERLTPTMLSAFRQLALSPLGNILHDMVEQSL